MPLYTYRCNDCDHQFEQRQRMLDDPLTDCPTCDGSVRRVINSVGIVFKGSGFYVTDTKNGSANGVNGSNGTADSRESKADDSGAANSGNGEAKSASKPAAETSSGTPPSG